MNIKFLPFDKKKENTSLRAFVYHRGQEYRVSVGESVLTKYWNENKNRCKLVREYPEGPVINKNLDNIEKIIKDLVNGYGLVTPTEAQIRNDFKNYRKNMNIESGGIADDEQKQYFVDFAVKFMNESDRKLNTRKSYQTTINKLLEYEKKYRIKLRFIDIDIEFYNKFKKWLLETTCIKNGVEYHYTKNYIGSIFKNIAMFMNKSNKKKLHDFSGHKDEDFKVEKEEVDTIYLNVDEIEKIYNLEFTEEFLLKNGYKNKKPNLQRAIKSLNEERDRFLIGCYTALRHSDYSRIDILNFKEALVSIWTVKKDKKVYIPIHYRLREIMQRRNNVLPTPISEQKHNEQIKAIGRLAGIDDKVLLTKTRGGVRENITGKKYEFITSHTCRRSGASNMYLAGIDIKFIQDIFGNSKIEKTLKFIKVAAEENAKRLLEHPYFTGKK
ncbi:MAG: site-specific integrase [Dysgonamonadaceae bacterium]|jgi:site-specific recombinase XerD|nr:site-specific integrase [Dysgonamonadaceae bacterium]